MKRLLLLLPVVALGGCNYKSMSEAQTACWRWEIEGQQITYKCEKKQPWHKDCISAEERDARVRAAKEANTADGIVDMKAAGALIKEIPQALTSVVISPRRCELERETKQIMGYEQGRLLRRFRY